MTDTRVLLLPFIVFQVKMVLIKNSKRKCEIALVISLITINPHYYRSRTINIL